MSDGLTPEEKRVASEVLPWSLPRAARRQVQRRMESLYSAEELEAYRQEMELHTALYVAEETERQQLRAAGDPGGTVKRWEGFAARVPVDQPPSWARITPEDEPALLAYLQGLAKD